LIKTIRNLQDKSYIFQNKEGFGKKHAIIEDPGRSFDIHCQLKAKNQLEGMDLTFSVLGAENN